MHQERYEPDSPWHRDQIRDLREQFGDDLKFMTDEQVWDWWEGVMAQKPEKPEET